MTCLRPTLLLLLALSTIRTATSQEFALAAASATAVVPAGGASAAAQQIDFTNLRSSIVSPEVSDDRRVTLRVFAPDAEQVVLAGGTLLLASGGTVRAPLAFARDQQGIWTLTTPPLATPELHNYRLQIDGADAIDYANPRVIVGSGSPNSLVEIAPAQGRAFWQPAPNIARGTVHRHRYDSALGDVRELHVYTPPGYDPTGEPMPVLYLLHGGGEIASSWSDIGRVDVIADNLIAAGRMRPAIIVMPLGHAVRRGATDSPATDWAGRNTEAFRRDLFDAIMPFAERTYRIRTDRAGRALAGLSMGAGQADTIGLAALDQFSVIGLFSGGGRDFTQRHAALLADPAATNSQLAWLYIGVGSTDGLVLPSVRPMHEELKAAGIRHTYQELQGYGHSWPVWRHILYHEFLPRLFAAPAN